MQSIYANSHPAASGDVVKQGHADYCRDNGHAYYIVDGVDQGYCSRCGASTSAPVAASSAVSARRSMPGVVTDLPTDAATVVMFGRNGLCGPGVPGAYDRTSRTPAPAPEWRTLQVCEDCAQCVSGISAHERGQEYAPEVLEAVQAYPMGNIVNGDCGDDGCPFSWEDCELCGSVLGGIRHAVDALS